MRRKLPLLLGAFFLAFSVVACEGPEGPQGEQGPVGPTGATGATGEQGPPGTDGTNAAETCTDCHSADATIVAIQKQYEESQHGTGETFERDTNPCNTCHTDQGFLANLDGETIDDVPQPAPVNCRTCHMIHQTGTAADFALTTTDEVTLLNGGTFDFGNGNLCANCHQARPYDDDDLSAATAVLGSRAGYHHGTQANVLSGQAGLDMTGFAITESGAHAHGEPGCTFCHMQEPYGAQAGGHTWDMRYVYHGAEAILVPGAEMPSGLTCTTCHATLPAGANTQVTVGAQLDSIATLLRAAGAMQAAPSTREIEGTYDTDLVKAFLNFKLIEEDFSLGVHNPDYARDVLDQTQAFLEAFLVP